MSDRYAILPADSPRGTHYQAWVIRDRATTECVKALPPADEPLRFYSYAQAQAWVRTNTRIDSWGLWNRSN